jgi:transposase
MMEYGIKFRPNKPGSPHLNSKVERSQKTDKTEFYATVDITSENLQDQFNWLNGKITIIV